MPHLLRRSRAENRSMLFDSTPMSLRSVMRREQNKTKKKTATTTKKQNETLSLARFPSLSLIARQQGRGDSDPHVSVNEAARQSLLTSHLYLIHKTAEISRHWHGALERVGIN